MPKLSFFEITDFGKIRNFLRSNFGFSYPILMKLTSNCPNFEVKKSDSVTKSGGFMLL